MQDQDQPRPSALDPEPDAAARIAPPEPRDWENCPIDLEIDHDRRVNFAMQQNDVPVIKRLRLINRGDEAVDDIVLGLRIAGDVSEEKRLRIDRLPPGGEFLLERLDLDLDPRSLAARTEREKTRLEIQLTSGDRCRQIQAPIEILAHNEWAGAGSLPEMIAAFIQPNHPGIDGLLAAAQRLLATRDGSGNIEGYQSGSPERALREMRAIYDALAAQEISYVGVAASFEEQGQKVRLPGAVFEHRLGNCLDLSLLLAAAFEQAGFNPLVVLVKGHAFIAAWTGELNYPEPTIDDAARLRKRIDLGDLLVIESTMVTQKSGHDFERARAEARRHLERDEDFILAIDIACARRLKIRPLPARLDLPRREEELDATQLLDTGVIRTLGLDEVPEAEADEDLVAEMTGTAPAGPEPVAGRGRRETRLDRWKRRLLDLSLRNRLLNFRATKKTLALSVPDAAALEDRLAEGGEFSLLPRPALADESSPRDLAVMTERMQEDALRSFLVEEMRAGRLHGELGAEEHERRLVEIQRAARSDLEETGANTLHLALGFLSWYETESSDQERRAPILMLPVELLRRSARSEFRLRLAEDEARINVTLLEKLRRDHQLEIEGLDELPVDDSGLDIEAIFRRVRAAIVDLPRWDLIESSALGLFSFNKFLMWQDLELHAESLKGSPIVRHLVDQPGRSFEPEADYGDALDLDRDLPPQEVFCPLDADSSQLAAVVAASSGRSFVLQGPPGTGKSQTIANLIAQALAKGLRVLFVAEKMAALDVVHARLSRIGLAGACLELHSNKSSKRHVLEQLRQAIEETGTQAPADWERRCVDLAGRRAALNAYVAEIHRRHEPGSSIFDATARLIAMRARDRVELGEGLDRDLEGAAFQERRELAAALGAATTELDDLATHPLRGLGRGDWTPRLGREIGDALDALEAAAEEWRQALVSAATLLELEETAAASLDRSDIGALVAILRLVLDCPGAERDLLVEPDFERQVQALRAAIARGLARDELRAELLRRWQEGMLTADPGPQLDALQRARESFWPLSRIRSFLVRRGLRAQARGRLPDDDSLIADLQRLRKLREEDMLLAAPGSDEAHFFGRHWRAGRADWKQLAAVLDWAGRFRSAWSELAAVESTNLRERLLALVTRDRELVLAGNPRRRLLERMVAAGDGLDRRLGDFESLTEFDSEEGLDPEAEGLVAAVDRLAGRLRAGLRDLKPWCHWARLRREGAERGLGPLALALARGRIAPDEAAEVFEKSYLEAWLDRRLEASDLLLRFSSREHERLIESFRALDRQHMDLARDELRARIAARAPGFERQVSARSEVGILQRQLKLKRRHLPIRKLFESLPELLPRLKPCLLMSPLSVAQYLGPDFPRADLVIFDEASQIPVWDAIGALARGRAAVVVGDSRQLPPTSFFERAGEEEVDEEMVEELESILDECEAGGLKSLRLLWHYRSRHEGLIAFSNHHYYDGRLQTFPSPAGQESARGVALVPVAGCYDRSDTATNEAEARAVVAELIRRLETPGESRSIGVVAFSKAQQDLILDLLDQARRERAEIDLILAEESEEPIFVKNLENVQGDERDLILFSICYGPDAQGKLSMNFGPLNREGGERRLNVAITRARRELLVFASLRPEQIDLARSQALGVGHLKSFLEYAERGPRALGDQVVAGHGRRSARPFEDAVAEALEARGFQVDRNLGCSSFRIDVAVRDPRAPERHLLGLLGDGLAYRDAASARDRDRIREGVLGALGWRLARIWSQDWYQDPERELGRLLARIEALLVPEPTGTTAADEPAAVPDPEEAPADDPQADAVTDAALDPPTAATTEPVEPPALVPIEPEAVPEADDGPEGPEPERLQNPAPAAARNEYVETPLKLRQLDLDEARASSMVDEMMLAVVEAEWPVHHELVIRRVARAAGIERITHKVKRIFGERLQALEDAARLGRDQDFLFAAGRGADDVSSFRLAPERGSPRDAEHIHPAEIALAAAEVIASQIALPADELLREISRVLGYSRTSARMLRYLQAGVDLLAARGGCIIDEDSVRLPRDEDAS
ncbi:MAG: DUF3320 domain-containing protein [Planctomycetes bacterium]|nr:DUF3320 domain-containing protein [Planctomycetota bacterium]